MMKKRILFIILGIFILLVITFLSIFLTSLIYKKNNKTDDYNVSNEIEYMKQDIDVFDRLIAYGPKNNTMLGYRINYSIIANSSIISDEDLAILKESGEHGQLCIYFGIKNNQDYIYIFEPTMKIDYLFKSNLNYSFLSIIDDFKSTYNIELNQEYLNEIKYDDAGNLYSGLIINFIKNDEGIYNIAYLANYNGKCYVINK